MDKKKIVLKDMAKVNPFTTPEGYFENFTNDIMSQLPNVVRENSISVSRWQRVRPWIYMAAMFAGIAVMLRLFVGIPASSETKNYALEGFKLTSSTDIDDYYHYYEDELARLVYDDAFYLANNTEDTY